MMVSLQEHQESQCNLQLCRLGLDKVMIVVIRHFKRSLVRAYGCVTPLSSSSTRCLHLLLPLHLLLCSSSNRISIFFSRLLFCSSRLTRNKVKDEQLFIILEPLLLTQSCTRCAKKMLVWRQNYHANVKDKREPIPEILSMRGGT